MGEDVAEHVLSRASACREKEERMWGDRGEHCVEEQLY